jgi:hypothetical protein
MAEPAIADDPTSREGLVKWLEMLHDFVYELRTKQFIFKTIWRLVEENPELRARQSHIYVWLHDLYAEGMAMAIRRLCDRDDRTVSIVRFLQFVKRDPSVISRAAYGDLFPQDTITAPGLPQAVRSLLRERIINEGYDQSVGKDVLQPRGKDIGKEIGELTRLAASIVEYANRRVAHHDKTPPSTFPTLTDIDLVLDHAAELVQKYVLLLKATSTDLRVHFQYDWLAPLRVPWLPDHAVRNGGFKNEA